MKYYLYHIPGKKIGVTQSLARRVEQQQGYDPSEYEIIEESEDVDYISSREIELQKLYGYRVDETLYKNLNQNKSMRVNVTDQTTTFPVPLNKLKGRLMDNIGMSLRSMFGNYELTPSLANWIVKNAITSQFNNERCYVYNKAMAKFMNTTEIYSLDKEDEQDRLSVYDRIRDWAADRGIFDKGSTTVQFTKLVEETGELAQGILKKDKPEIMDAIGDMIVVLTNLAHLEGLTIEDCIESAYAEIKNREGKMVNGTFVKTTL